MQITIARHGTPPFIVEAGAEGRASVADIRAAVAAAVAKPVDEIHLGCCGLWIDDALTACWIDDDEEHEEVGDVHYLYAYTWGATGALKLHQSRTGAHPCRRVRVANPPDAERAQNISTVAQS